MSGLENNKIFAAILTAGVIAMFSGFVAEKLIHPHKLDHDAVSIEVAMDGAESIVAKVAAPDPIDALLASADIARGQKLSRACAACHSFDKGGINKVGPNLWGVTGAKKAGKSSFKYSNAMIAKGGTWSTDDLNHFLWKPKKFIKGTKMSYVGIKKTEDRAAMVAWLKTLR